MKNNINHRAPSTNRQPSSWIISATVILTFIFLIAPLSTLAQQDGKEFCWRDSYGRGVGSIPSDCAPGQEKVGLLCYSTCPAGMQRAGVDCHSICPQGLRDDGLFCRAAEYGRGAGYALWNENKCNQENPQGCEKNGALWYPKCKSGYEAFGCCLCRPKKPDCAALGLNPGVDLSCGKKIQIGDVHTASCPPGQDYDAGLCYEKCKTGYTGVGPVCWGQAPPGWSECGMGAAKDSKTCASIIFGQVAAIGQLAMTVASLGSSTALNAGMSAPAKAGKLAKLKQQYSALKVQFDLLKQNSKAVQGAIDTFDAANKGKKGYVAMETAENNVVTEEDMVRLAAQIAAIMDPTGIADTVAAFTYPKCSKYGFSPTGQTPMQPSNNVLETSWLKIDGGATNIAVNQQGNAWITNSEGRIFEYNGSRFAEQPGSANDIGVGANGTVWVIGTDAQPGGYGIHRWNGSAWDKMPGGAVRLAVGPTGNAWVVNDEGKIFEYNGSEFTEQPGSARDIGVGANGTVWVIGTDAQTGGYSIHRWNGSSWERVPGGAVRIAVGPTGNAWIVNEDGRIYEYNGTTFIERSGSAKDVSVGANGAVWVVGSAPETGGFGIYRMN